MANETRAGYFEIWSRTNDGGARKHGTACGVTFDDACKHLASESIDFWTHYDKGRYRGQRLYESQGAALAAGASGVVAAVATPAVEAERD